MEDGYEREYDVPARRYLAALVHFESADMSYDVHEVWLHDEARCLERELLPC